MLARRAFLAGVIGVVAAPLAPEAQPAGKVFRIGYLSIGDPRPGAPDIPQFQALLAELRNLGYVEGQNPCLSRDHVFAKSLMELQISSTLRPRRD